MINENDFLYCKIKQNKKAKQKQYLLIHELKDITGRRKLHSGIFDGKYRTYGTLTSTKTYRFSLYK